MKTVNKSMILLLVTALVTVTIISCKKDRIQSDDYQSMDSFYDNNKEQEQDYTIDSLGGNCYVTCQKGTRICTTADMQQFSGGGPVYYTYQLKVVELYSIKDMILWRAPSVSSSAVLETSAEIRVRTVKNGTETELKPGRAYYMEMANMPLINNNMQAHYGFLAGSSVNWTNSLASLFPGFVDTLSLVNPTPSYYMLNVAKTGFVSAARPAPVTGSNTTVTMTVAGTNTQNIQIFLSFTGFKGVIKAENMTTSIAPIGEQVKMIAFAKKQDGNFYMHQQTLTISANLQVPLNMVVSSEPDILAALGGL
jgi:hypothetical protein